MWIVTDQILCAQIANDIRKCLIKLRANIRLKHSAARACRQSIQRMLASCIASGVVGYGYDQNRIDGSLGVVRGFQRFLEFVAARRVASVGHDHQYMTAFPIAEPACGERNRIVERRPAIRMNITHGDGEPLLPSGETAQKRYGVIEGV